MRHGKGNLFHWNGVLEYEGDFIKGNKSGKGKEYNEKGELIYEGGFLDNLKHGKGKELYKGIYKDCVQEIEYDKGKEMGNINLLILRVIL